MRPHRLKRWAIRRDRCPIERSRRIGDRDHGLVHDLNNLARVEIDDGPKALDRTVEGTHVAERKAGALEQAPAFVLWDSVVAEAQGLAGHFVQREAPSRERSDELLAFGQDVADAREFLPQEARLDSLDLGPRRHRFGGQVHHRLEGLRALLHYCEGGSGEALARTPREDARLRRIGHIEAREPRVVVHVARCAQNLKGLRVLVRAQWIERVRDRCVPLSGAGLGFAAGE